MPQITNTGVKTETLDEIKQRIIQSLKDIDPDWNLDPSTIDMQKVQVDTLMFSELNDFCQQIYRALDPDSCSRDALLNMCRISGVRPKNAAASTGQVEVSGNPGTFIPKGSRIRSIKNEVMWSLDDAVTLDQDGKGTANVTCTVKGAITASPGDLSQIVDVIGGWTSVNNKVSAVTGYDVESTGKLRIRRNKSVANPSSNQVDKMYAAIAGISGVQFVEVYENRDGATDSNGLDGHSIAIYVQGGQTQDVSNAIANNIVYGPSMNKNSAIAGTKHTVTGVTTAGRDVEITYRNPNLIDVFVEVEMVGGTDSTAAAIKKAIVNYANGELFADSDRGFDKTGFKIGESVHPAKLYSPANMVVGDDGFVKPNIKIGKSADAVSENTLAINFYELSVFNESNIKVTRTAL